MATINFILSNNNNHKIICKLEDELKNIIIKFLNINKKRNNELYFLFNGKAIFLNNKYKIKDFNKNNINIFVFQLYQNSKYKKRKEDKKELKEINKKIYFQHLNNKDEKEKDINIQLKELKKLNYSNFYCINHFCDYLSDLGWRAGYIIDIENNNYKIMDVTKNSEEEFINIPQTIIINEKKMSYFRKYSEPNNIMVKGTSMYLKKKLLQFINFHNNFNDFFENCENYDFYYFLRVTVYYGLDFCMNSNINKNEIEISFRLILIILNIICNCLNYINDNLEDFLEYENKIKNTQLKDIVLINKKYAIFSFFDDINFLIRKIFGDSKDYLDWYIIYEDEINKFNPSINDNPHVLSISELFPLYKDQKGGYYKYRLIERICLPEVYIRTHKFYTLDKKISSCIIAYFVDYFNYLGGYTILFRILYSISNTYENYNSNCNIQYLIINDLLTAKVITGVFYNHKNEIIKLKNYIENYSDKFGDTDLEGIKKSVLNNLFSKIYDLIKNNEDEKTIFFEGIYISNIIKEFSLSDKLTEKINLLRNLNNIIKTVQSNKTLKENENHEFNMDILFDKKLEGKNEKIKKIDEEYFCNICQKKKFINIFLNNWIIHEEIVVRLFPMLYIMYSNNYAYNKNENQKKIEEVSTQLFTKLFEIIKNSELNNESLWRNVLNIIINICQYLSSNDKNYVFMLIKRYFNESINKNKIKLIPKFNFIIMYTLKCFDKKNEKLEDFIPYNKDSDLEENGIIKGVFNEKKFYFLEILISFLINKEKLKDLKINNEMEIEIIKMCSDGIIEILNKNKLNENLIKIMVIKIINGIISSINTIQNINLLQKILQLDINENIINDYCKEKNIMKVIFNEFLVYLKNKKDINEQEFKIEIEKRLDLIFLLMEHDILNNYDDFNKLFNELINDSKITKEILYSKIKNNILRIYPSFQKYIFDNILLNKNTNFIINDFMNYQLFKEFILQINKSRKIFKFISGKEIIIQFHNNMNDIYGYNSLFNILLETSNKYIRDDVSNFLKNIYLGIRFNSIKEYQNFWKNIINKIIEKFKIIIKKDKIDNNAINNLVILLKKIIEESNNDGNIISKNIIDDLFETLIIKKKNEKKETNEDIKNKENEEDLIKISLEYYDIINNERTSYIKESEQNFFLTDIVVNQKKRKIKTFEVYPGELFYHLRYYISYQFKIPLKCIQIKTINHNFTKNEFQKYTLFNDCISILETLSELKQNNQKVEKKEEVNLPLFTIEKIKNPLNDEQEYNLKNMILENKELSNILEFLLNFKNYDYSINILYIINNKEKINKEKEIHELINNNINKEELLNELFNFNDSNIIYMNYVLSIIYNNYLKKNDNKVIEKFIKSKLWQNKIKYLNLNIKGDNVEDINNHKYFSINELFEQKNYEKNLLNIYISIVNNISSDNETLDFVIQKIFDVFYNIINDCISIDFNKLYSDIMEDKDNNINNLIKIYNNILININYLFENNKNIFSSFLKLLLNEVEKENDMKKKFEFCFTVGIIKNNYLNLNQKIIQLLLILIKNFDQKNYNMDNLQKNFYLFISSIFYTKNNNEKILRIIEELLNKKDNIEMSKIIKFKYNVKIFYDAIAEILLKIYKLIFKDFDFDNYIFMKIIPSIYNSLLKGNKNINIFDEIIFGGHCLILSNYILYINSQKYEQIQNYYQKSLNKFLFNEMIMNCNSIIFLNEKSNSINNINPLYHLFITSIIKEINYNKYREIDNNYFFYLNEINELNKLNYRKGKETKVYNWNLCYNDENKIKTFVGLKNFGCTSYINCILQIFFQSINFRESLLECSCNSLFEIQKVFLYLKYSKKNNHYIPDSLINNFICEKINVNHQMDVDEFFLNILGILENQLKHTDNENLIKYFFQGKIIEILNIQNECNHHRIYINNFFTIYLQIKNKKNIHESLDTLIEEELINYNNRIFCDLCRCSVPVKKSLCFKILPRILVFVLKRYEFNFDEMNGFKINDYYEFPLELDMDKYTYEFINNKNINKNNTYSLKSVIIHDGNINEGHYYTIIKDSLSSIWYKFDDIEVSLFDINNLPKESFGDKDTITDKVKSAYILFYEKCDTTNCENFEKIEGIILFK